MSQRSYRSIGDVLTLLREEFPDVTISKIRFLESQGLVSPQRSPSGYRKFYDEDVERLRYVLLQQREHFLPLKVIRDRLVAGEPIATSDAEVEPAGESAEQEAATGVEVESDPPPTPAPTTSGTAATASSVADLVAALQEAPAVERQPSAPRPAAARPEPQTDPSALVELLTAEELSEQTGLELAQIASLEEYGILRATRVAGLRCYAGDEVMIASAAKRVCDLGIEPRHLRSFRTSVDREMDLYEQLTVPLLHQRSPEGRAQAQQLAADLAEAGRRLRASMMGASIDRLIGG